MEDRPSLSIGLSDLKFDELPLLPSMSICLPDFDWGARSRDRPGLSVGFPGLELLELRDGISPISKGFSSLEGRALCESSGYWASSL